MSLPVFTVDIVSAYTLTLLVRKNHDVLGMVTMRTHHFLLHETYGNRKANLVALAGCGAQS